MKFTHTFKFLSMATICSGFLLAVPKNVVAITIQEAVDQAVTTNPEALDFKSRYEAAKKRVGQAEAGYFPTIDFSAGIGQERTDNSSTQGRSLPHEDLTRRESGLTLNQTLFDGFSVQHSVTQLESQLKSAEFSLMEIQEKIAIQTVQAYMEALMQGELFELIKDNVHLHQSILKKVKIRAKAGISGLEDVHQTESRLSLASAKLALRQAAYQNARDHFERVVGVLPENLVRPNTRKDLIPESKVMAVEKAKKGHFSLLSAQSDLDAAKYAQEIAKAKFFPKVNFELSANNDFNTSGSPGESTNAAAMLRLKYNLFSGGGDKARVGESLDQVNQALEVLENNRREIVESTKVAWNNIELSQKRLAFLKNHAKNSQQVTSNYHTQFKMGKRSLLDVLNSENELFEARTALITEQSTLISKIYQISRSMGQLQSDIRSTYSDSLEESTDAQESIPEDRMLSASERLSDSYSEYNRQESLQLLQNENPMMQTPNPFAHNTDTMPQPSDDAAMYSPSLSQRSVQQGSSPEGSNGLTAQDRFFIKGVLERLMANHDAPSVRQSTDQPYAVEEPAPAMSPEPSEPSGEPLPDEKSLSKDYKTGDDGLQSNSGDQVKPSAKQPLKGDSDKSTHLGETEKANVPGLPVEQNYVVRIGLFRSEKFEYVDRLTQSLRASGVPIIQEHVEIRGKKHVRVHCGPYSSLIEAEKSLANLAKNHGITGTIGPTALPTSLLTTPVK